MKIYAPEYYSDFKCIADKCRHSCCIGWEIDIDSDTAERYLSMTKDYGRTVAQSVDTNDTPHFILTNNDRCPHLAQNGLCNIILNLGEDSLCEICREHPRFYNLTPHGMEAGLGISCEEACRIVLSSDGYMKYTAVGEWEGDIPSTDFDSVREREEIYKTLSDRRLPYSERLSEIQKKYSVNISCLSDREWHEVIWGLEYLDEAHKALFRCFSSSKKPPSELEPAAERALAYFIYRHTPSEETYRGFVSSLGFCLFCERLLASLIASDPSPSLDKAAEYARIISEEIEYSEENTEDIRSIFWS